MQVKRITVFSFKFLILRRNYALSFKVQFLERSCPLRTDWMGGGFSLRPHRRLATYLVEIQCTLDDTLWGGQAVTMTFITVDFSCLCLFCSYMVLFV